MTRDHDADADEFMRMLSAAPLSRAPEPPDTPFTRSQRARAEFPDFFEGISARSRALRRARGVHHSIDVLWTGESLESACAGQLRVQRGAADEARIDFLWEPGQLRLGDQIYAPSQHDEVSRAVNELLVPLLGGSEESPPAPSS